MQFSTIRLCHRRLHDVFPCTQRVHFGRPCGLIRHAEHRILRCDSAPAWSGSSRASRPSLAWHQQRICPAKSGSRMGSRHRWSMATGASGRRRHPTSELPARIPASICGLRRAEASDVMQRDACCAVLGSAIAVWQIGAAAAASGLRAMSGCPAHSVTGFCGPCMGLATNLGALTSCVAADGHVTNMAQSWPAVNAAYVAAQAIENALCCSLFTEPACKSLRMSEITTACLLKIVQFTVSCMRSGPAAGPYVAWSSASRDMPL